VLATAPVVRSGAARMLFLSAGIITAAVLFWTQYFFPSRGGGLSQIFLVLFEDLDGKAASWTLAILVLAVCVSGVFSGRRLLEWISNHMLSVAAVTVALLCAGTLIVYRNHPLAMDEYAQYLQSQVFAAGKLSGSFPVALMDWLVPPGFQNYFISVSKSTGAVASGYWPSFALLMSPFTALGIPWACNPVISAATLLAAHRLALNIYGDRNAAALVVLLTAASPEFFVNGISYYSMPAHLLANTLYALLVLDPTRSKLFLAGVIGSIALTLHNPFPHLLFALPWILWIAGRHDGNRMTLWLAAGYAPLCLLLGFGWFWFTGHLRQSGMPASSGGGDLDSMWQTLSVFSLPDASVLLARMIGIAKICVWSAPGLIVLAVAGAWKGWSHPALRLLTISASLTLLGYLLVPVDQGHGWGYRYFHSAWIVLPVLAAGALTRTKIGRSENTFEDEDSRAFVVTCAVLMLLIGGTCFAVQIRKFMTFDLAQAPAYSGTEHRIVLINTNYGFYSGDLVQNDPWLRGNVIRMLSHGRDGDARMMAQNFPDMHEVYADPHGVVWSTAPLSGHERRP
jgi:hypothetical protein